MKALIKATRLRDSIIEIDSEINELDKIMSKLFNNEAKVNISVEIDKPKNDEKKEDETFYPSGMMVINYTNPYDKKKLDFDKSLNQSEAIQVLSSYIEYKKRERNILLEEFKAISDKLKL